MSIDSMVAMVGLFTIVLIAWFVRNEWGYWFPKKEEEEEVDEHDPDYMNQTKDI